MAIVPLQRINLIGELKHRERIMRDIQRLGCLHVVNLTDLPDKTAGSTFRAEELKSAIAYLERCPEKRHPLSQPADSTTRGFGHPDHADVTRIAGEVLQIESESRALTDELDSVSELIEQLKPWGDFQRPSPSQLRGRRLYFYQLTHREALQLPLALDADSGVYLINRDPQFEYWLVVAKQPPTGFSRDPEDLDSRSLAELQTRLAEIGEQQEQLQLQRIAMTRWLQALRRELATTEDETMRMDAQSRSLVDGPVFALQAWAPQNQITTLESFARENTLALTVRPPTADDEPPTLLTNPRPIAGAEGAVTFFMTPAYRAWDPTWVMFFSFAAFFAMIMADAGYGLVLGLMLAVYWKRLGHTEAGRRFRQLAIFMVLVTIGYGVVIGSYFGFSPPPESLLDRVVIKSGGLSIMQDREAMMLVSATIGVFHLVLANSVVAWRWLGSGHALSAVGWVISLIGGWLMTVCMLPKPDVKLLLAERLGGQSDQWDTSLTSIGWWMLGLGLALVLLFSSTRPVFSLRPRDLLTRLGEGLLGLTGVTKAFGDALSYLRLFALGLASAQLAMLFNDMASNAAQIKGLGILLGLLVFLLGHTLNFVLAVVGGVVHGLRLNCIEFFSWSLTDEGKPFEAFEMRANK